MVAPIIAGLAGGAAKSKGAGIAASYFSGGGQSNSGARFNAGTEATFAPPTPRAQQKSTNSFKL